MISLFLYQLRQTRINEYFLAIAVPRIQTDGFRFGKRVETAGSISAGLHTRRISTCISGLVSIPIPLRITIITNRTAGPALRMARRHRAVLGTARRHRAVLGTAWRHRTALRSARRHRTALRSARRHRAVLGTSAAGRPILGPALRHGTGFPADRHLLAHFYLFTYLHLFTGR